MGKAVQALHPCSILYSSPNTEDSMKAKKRSVKSVVKKVNKTLLNFRQKAAEFITDIGETRPTDMDYAGLYALLKQVYNKGLRDGRKKPK
jgi:hypothetical protein